MAACNFSVSFKGKIDQILDKVKEKAKKDDVEFKGDTDGGTFHVRKPDIRGSYAVKGQKVNFSIADHPWYASCDAIESKVNDFFRGL